MAYLRIKPIYGSSQTLTKTSLKTFPILIIGREFCCALKVKMIEKSDEEKKINAVGHSSKVFS